MNPCFPYIPHRAENLAGQPANASSFYIRTAYQSDLSSLAEILADSFHPRTGIARWLYPLLRLGIYEDLRIRLSSTSPHSLCFVAVACASTQTGYKEYLAGTVEIALRSSPSWQHRNLQYPYISNLAVRKSCRRKGVAGQLLLKCERTALEWGFQDLYLHVLENNHQARQLYLKTGYRLQQVDPVGYDCLLPIRPRRLFLHKHLAPRSREMGNS